MWSNQAENRRKDMEQGQKPQRKWQISFFAIWTGQQLSLISSAVAEFALVWWLTKTTGSATVLTMATAIAVLPWVIGGPFAGALVDRWNRRMVMIVADGVIALVSAWLAILFWIDAMQFWHVYIILFLRALGGMFHVPAMMASTSLMVPQEHLPRVSGLNQAINGALGIIAPPLGALLLSLLPLHAIMGLDVATAAIAITLLLFAHIPQPPQTVPAGDALPGKPSLWADLREGVRYLWSWPGMVGVCALAMLLNFLLSPTFALLPMLVVKDLGGEAMQLGWLNSAWGIGVIVGGLALGVWGGFRRRIITMLVGDIGLGVGVLIVGVTPAALFPLMLVGMFVGAVMNAMSNGTANALMQQVVAPDKQGRVFMLIGSLTSVTQPISLAIAGPVADAFGVRAWVIAAGVVAIAIGVGSFFVPVLMRLEDDPNQPAPAQERATVSVTTQVI
jgi:DHA3 family macrolide efflux protein-like MFS transporter